MKRSKNVWLRTALGLCCVVLAASCAHDRGGRVESAAPGDARTGLVDVKCNADAYIIHLGGDAGRIELTNAQNPASVPAGKYALLASYVRVKDVDGATWHASGMYHGSGRPFEVKAGATATLAVGPPLTAEFSSNKSGDAVALSVSVHDAAGLMYLPRDITRDITNDIIKDRRVVKPPGVTIRDAAGVIVAQGSFKYG